MKKSLWLTVPIALVLVALGWIANQEAAWAAPGHSPARQTYPSRTPTSEPVTPTNVPPPPTAVIPTQAPSPPTEIPTPVPVIPTSVPVTPTPVPVTPTLVPVTPTDTPSPTSTTVSRQPAGEAATVTARASLSTRDAEETRIAPTATGESPSEGNTTPTSTEVQLVSTLAGTPTTQSAVPGAGGIAVGWWFAGGVVLLAAGGLLLILGRRRGGK